MLYFSKLKVIFIYILIILLSYFSISNFLSQNYKFSNKKINLGLDLQGGSYLLLEVDSNPIVLQRLQKKFSELKKYFKNQNIKFKNIKIGNNQIQFEIEDSSIDTFVTAFTSKNDNLLNNYLEQYKAFEFDHTINNNKVFINYSKFGIIEIKNSTIDQALEIVRRRIDEVGTNEPNILKRGNERILVELPGLDDPARIKNLLGKTANLSFRFITDQDSSDFGSEKMFFEDGSEEAIVSKRIILSGDNLIDANPRMDTQTNQTVVTFSMDRLGTKKFAKATIDGVGKRLAIILDNKIISAPVIREAITGGNGQISGDFTFQSATDLALLLRSGALPAPLSIIEERTVGPDLGKDSIDAGTIALIIGFILVNIFMLLRYRLFGLIADLTLVVNLFLLVGILTIFEATLTLPGIAGIILTVGMAVDANVLIFERIKEEIKVEKNNLIAFDGGYKRARTAVLDANITTLIAAVILFFFGSGPVKGFAITLGIGIVSTLFSVFYFARHLTSVYVSKNKDKTITL